MKFSELTYEWKYCSSCYLHCGKKKLQLYKIEKTRGSCENWSSFETNRFNETNVTMKNLKLLGIILLSSINTCVKKKVQFFRFHWKINCNGPCVNLWKGFVVHKIYMWPFAFYFPMKTKKKSLQSLNGMVSLLKWTDIASKCNTCQWIAFWTLLLFLQTGEHNCRYTEAKEGRPGDRRRWKWWVQVQEEAAGSPQSQK